MNKCIIYRSNLTIMTVFSLYCRFMDMYMASIEKQLLGSEAVALLRSMGVESRICGLSAKYVCFYH